MSFPNPFRQLFEARTNRVLLFLLASAPIGALTLGLLIAGWTSVAVLAVTPLVAAGGTALDPEVVSQLLGQGRREARAEHLPEAAPPASESDHRVLAVLANLQGR
jgi:hypothetical protein